jgi:hypothetical protein
VASAPGTYEGPARLKAGAVPPRHRQPSSAIRPTAQAAADVLADRRLFVLDEQAWQVFDQALSRPAAEVPGLRELLSAPTGLGRDAAEPPPAQAGR